MVGVTSGCRLTADGRNLQGVRLFQQAQYQQALNEFQQAIASNPTNADAYYNLASTYHRLASVQNDSTLRAQAEELYNRCLDIDGNHVECHRGLAVLLAQTGRTDRSLALLKNWVVRSPNNADARIELARLYDEFGQDDNAKIELHEAIKRDVNNDRAWAALAFLNEQDGQYASALANYQRSLNIKPTQPQLAQRIVDLNRRLASRTTDPSAGVTRLR